MAYIHGVNEVGREDHDPAKAVEFDMIRLSVISAQVVPVLRAQVRKIRLFYKTNVMTRKQFR